MPSSLYRPEGLGNDRVKVYLPLPDRSNRCGGSFDFGCIALFAFGLCSMLKTRRIRVAR